MDHGLIALHSDFMGGKALQVLSALVAAIFAVVVSSVTAVPSAAALQPSRGEFVSENQDAKLRFVRNSGVCETTPGVEQLSGYIDIGTNMSMVSQPTSTSSRLSHICL